MGGTTPDPARVPSVSFAIDQSSLVARVLRSSRVAKCQYRSQQLETPDSIFPTLRRRMMRSKVRPDAKSRLSQSRVLTPTLCPAWTLPSYSKSPFRPKIRLTLASRASENRFEQSETLPFPTSSFHWSVEFARSVQVCFLWRSL